MMCPCKSQKKYEDCCKLYHTHDAIPLKPTALMRSRYSAYALGLADYIIQTTHPQNPEKKKNFWDWREDILYFSQQTEFIDLEILAQEQHNNVAFVTFTAILKQQGKDVSFTEKSRFEREEGHWLYLEAEFL